MKIGDSDGTMILADENGNTGEFEFLEMYVRDGSEYAVLLQKGDDMVTIMRFEEQTANGKEHFFSVDDDALFESIYRQFREDFKEEFDFDE